MFSSSSSSLNRKYIKYSMRYVFYWRGHKSAILFLYSISITWSWTLMPPSLPMGCACIFNVYIKGHKWIIKIEFINWTELCAAAKKPYLCWCQSKRRERKQFPKQNFISKAIQSLSHSFFFNKQVEHVRTKLICLYYMSDSMLFCIMFLIEYFHNINIDISFLFRFSFTVLN